MGGPFTVLECQVPAGPAPGSAARCDAVVVTGRALADEAAAARTYLEAHGLWPRGDAPLPVLLQEAPYGGTLTVPDLGPWVGVAWAGRPGILFGRIAGRATSDDRDLVTHELVHHWLRQSGADEPRWVLRDGRADGEAGLIQEGLANFVAAARDGDPLLGDAALARGQPRPSLRVFVRCPEALRGDAHDDSLVLSGALWEARAKLGGEVVLGAIAEAAPGAAGRLVDLDAALGRVFERHSEEAARTWRAISERHGLTRCDSPRPLPPGERVGARSESFVIPGREQLREGRAAAAPAMEFPAVAGAIGSPQSFALALPPGTTRATLTLRSSQKDTPRLTVAWRNSERARLHRQPGDSRRAEQVTSPGCGDGSARPSNCDGGAESGEVALEGWPVQQAELPVPAGATGLVLHLVSRAPGEVSYDDLSVTLAGGGVEVVPARATVVEPAERSSCGAGPEPIGALVILVAVAHWLRKGPCG